MTEAWHGSESGYAYHRCHCTDCRRGHAEYRRRRRAGRRNRPTPATVVHGKPSTYTNWGCHCSACVVAKAERDAADYVKRRSVAS